MGCYDKCLKLSSQIIDKYIELLMFSVDDVDSVMYSDIIDDIFELVLEEYKLIHLMNSEEIDRCINMLNSDDTNSEAVIRLKNKLTDYNEILNGVCINLDELGLDKINCNMKFSLYDAIISMINIDTIKSLKRKIYSLYSNCDGDDRFIELLKIRLNVSKIELLFNTNVSEIMALYYDASIDDIPRIDVNKIRNRIKKLGDKKYNSIIENSVIIFITRIIQELSKIRNVKNNDREVFNYLGYVTQIEVLINYLDKKKIQELYDFCIKMTNDENRISMNNIKRLVKNKIDN